MRTEKPAVKGEGYASFHSLGQTLVCLIIVAGLAVQGLLLAFRKLLLLVGKESGSFPVRR